MKYVTHTLSFITHRKKSSHYQINNAPYNIYCKSTKTKSMIVACKYNNNKTQAKRYVFIVKGTEIFYLNINIEIIMCNIFCFLQLFALSTRKLFAASE